MPTVKNVPTSTLLTANSNQFEIDTFLVNSCADENCVGGQELGVANSDLLPQTVFAKITDIVGTTNGTPHGVGDLLITTEIQPATINWSLTANGHLHVFTNANDAHRYFIDTDGHLKYDCCQTDQNPRTSIAIANQELQELLNLIR